MPAPTQQQPPPSWYREDGNPGVLRWWDGARWTEHRAPDPGFATRPAPWTSSGSPRWRRRMRRLRLRPGGAGA